MDKKIAMQALREGKRLKHWLFSDGEYIYYRDGYYYDERGTRMDIQQFWLFRSRSEWQNGWELI